MRLEKEALEVPVPNKKIEDSLLDLASYAILAYVDIKGGNE